MSDLMGQHAHIYIIAVKAGDHPALSDRENIDAHAEIPFAAPRLGIDPALFEHLAGESAKLRAKPAEAGDNHRLCFRIRDCGRRLPAYRRKNIIKRKLPGITQQFGLFGIIPVKRRQALFDGLQHHLQCFLIHPRSGQHFMKR
ncbi:hypothetical protein D3C75_806660 [compost metagenome]